MSGDSGGGVRPPDYPIRSVCVCDPRIDLNPNIKFLSVILGVTGLFPIAESTGVNMSDLVPQSHTEHVICESGTTQIYPLIRLLYCGYPRFVLVIDIQITRISDGLNMDRGNVRAGQIRGEAESWGIYHFSVRIVG